MERMNDEELNALIEQKLRDAPNRRITQALLELRDLRLSVAGGSKGTPDSSTLRH